MLVMNQYYDLYFLVLLGCIYFVGTDTRSDIKHSTFNTQLLIIKSVTKTHFINLTANPAMARTQ
jgi:hypothetical protein